VAALVDLQLAEAAERLAALSAAESLGGLRGAPHALLLPVLGPREAPGHGPANWGPPARVHLVVVVVVVGVVVWGPQRGVLVPRCLVEPGRGVGYGGGRGQGGEGGAGGEQLEPGGGAGRIM